MTISGRESAACSLSSNPGVLRCLQPPVKPFSLSWQARANAGKPSGPAFAR